MSDKVCDGDVTANALVLAIFKDNLRLHKRIEELDRYIDELKEAINRNIVLTDGPQGPDLWDWYNIRILERRSMPIPPLTEVPCK